MSLLVIVNNAASKARRAWPIVRQRLTQAGIDFEGYQTKQAGDATSRTREALRNDQKLIAVVGGDGTLSEVAEGFFEIDQGVDDVPSPISASAELAILPAGTGDDFARSEKGQRLILKDWLSILISHCREPAAHNIRVVDVLYGRCDNFQTPFICLNASTMGIGGETATRVAAQGKFMRSFSGETRFAAAALVRLAGWRERRVRVSVDGVEMVDGPMNLVAVANAVYAGGGMMLSPDAKVDDGKLDVVTASGLNRIEIVRELMRIHEGGHVANPKVKIAQGQSVTIETFAPGDAMPIEADGNVRGFTPVSFHVMPKALRFLVGGQANSTVKRRDFHI